MRLPSTLRGRLTAWHGLALGLVLVTFALGVYALFARSLLAEVDRSLVERAEEVNRTVRWDLPPWRPRLVVIPPPDRFASADTFVQVTALDGTVLGRSDNLRDAALPVAPEDLAAVRAGIGRFSLACLDGEPVRLYSAPPERGHIRVALEREGDQARLTVSDTGIGIDGADLPYIFQRFYRADRAHSADGTGLGLAIAKSVAESHGGRIAASNRPGEGSTFTVWLPAVS